MRGRRSKQYRKLMQQYGLTFGFREPYQVLIDAQMLQDTQRFKMDLVAGLERTLHGTIKPMITQCTIRHLYTLPTSSASTDSAVTTPSSPNQSSPTSLVLKNSLIELAKTFERRRCDHHTLEQPLSTLECFTSVLDPKASSTNKNRYVIASQDETVRRWARGVKGVPLVYVKRSVMVMEPMSEGSVDVREGVEKGKLRSGIRKVGRGADRGLKRAREEGEGEKEAEGDKEGSEVKKKRRRRGPKGPNPLSVKKSKREQEGGEEGKIRNGEEGKVKSGEEGKLNSGKEGTVMSGKEQEAEEDGEGGFRQQGGVNDTETVNKSTAKKGRRRKRKHGTTAGPVAEAVPQSTAEE